MIIYYLTLDDIYSLDHVLAHYKLRSRFTRNKKSQHLNHNPIKNLTESKALPSKRNESGKF